MGSMYAVTTKAIKGLSRNVKEDLDNFSLIGVLYQLRGIFSRHILDSQSILTGVFLLVITMVFRCPSCKNCYPIVGHLDFIEYENEDGEISSNTLCVWCAEDPPFFLTIVHWNEFVEILTLYRVRTRTSNQPDWIWQPNIHEVRPERDPIYLDKRRNQLTQEFLRILENARRDEYKEDIIGW